MTPIGGKKGRLRYDPSRKRGVACSVGIHVLVRMAPGKETTNHPLSQSAVSATGFNLLSYVTVSCMLTGSEQQLYVYTIFHHGAFLIIQD